MSASDQEDVDEEEDFLDELIHRYSKDDPEFSALLEAQERKRHKEWAITAERARLRRKRLIGAAEQPLVRALAAKRAELGLSQEKVARQMGVSLTEVAHLERGETDPRLSLLARYAAVLGQKLELQPSS